MPLFYKCNRCGNESKSAAFLKELKVGTSEPYVTSNKTNYPHVKIEDVCISCVTEIKTIIHKASSVNE